MSLIRMIMLGRILFQLERISGVLTLLWKPDETLFPPLWWNRQTYPDQPYHWTVKVGPFLLMWDEDEGYNL